MAEPKKEKKTVSFNAVLILITIFIGCGLTLLLVTQMEIIDGLSYDHSREMSENEDIGYSIRNNSLFLVLEDTNIREDRGTVTFTRTGFVEHVDTRTGGLIWRKLLPNNRSYFGVALDDYNNDNLPEYLVAFGVPRSSLTQTGADSYIINYSTFYCGVLNGSPTSGSSEFLQFDGTDSLLPFEVFSAASINYKNLTDASAFVVFHGDKTETLLPTAYNLTGYFINGSMAWQTPVNNLNSPLETVHSLDHPNVRNLIVHHGGQVSLVDGLNGSILQTFIMPFGERMQEVLVLNDLTGDGVEEFGLFVFNKTPGVPADINYTLEIRDATNLSIVFNKTFHTQLNVPNADRVNPQQVQHDATGQRIIFAYDIEDFESRLYVLGYSLTAVDVLHRRIKSEGPNGGEGITATFAPDVNRDGVSDLCIFRTEPGIITPDQQRSILELVDGRNYESIIWEVRGEFRPEYFFSIENHIVLINDAAARFYYKAGPFGFWIAFSIPMVGIPSFIGFIACIGLLAFALGYLVVNLVRKRFQPPDRAKFTKKVKRFMPFLIIVAAITIAMVVMAAMMASLLGFFDTTIMLGDFNTLLTLNLIFLFVLWFTAIPLIPALYNLSAPFFARLLVSLNRGYYKIFYRKSREHKILITQTEHREELGFFNTFSRLLLPMFLSIFVGITLYTYFATSKTFSFQDNSFMIFIFEYLMLAFFPSLLILLALVFFIPACWLLNDAGVVYYEVPTKHHLPSDISGVAGWTQNWLKGLAGIGTIISYASFWFSITFTTDILIGLLGGDMPLFFGAFLLVFFFYGFPIFSAMALIFLSIYVMEISLDENREKLYRKLWKIGVPKKKYELAELIQEVSIKPQKSERKETND